MARLKDIGGIGHQEYVDLMGWHLIGPEGQLVRPLDCRGLRGLRRHSLLRGDGR